MPRFVHLPSLPANVVGPPQWDEFQSVLNQQPQPPKPLFTTEEARNMIQDLSRKPFMDLLALFLGNHPTPKALSDFANKNPDKWSQATAIFSKLSGYNEELNVNLNVMAQVKVLSDMDLEAALKTINGQIGESSLIEHQIEVPRSQRVGAHGKRPIPKNSPTMHKGRKETKGRIIPKPIQSSL